MRTLDPSQVAVLGPDGKTRAERRVERDDRLAAGPRAPGAPFRRLLRAVGILPAASLKVGLERAVRDGMELDPALSKALLQLMTGSTPVVRNYGVAIVTLATLVRLVLHPLNVTA